MNNTIHGEVERVTFRNAENGFTVLRMHSSAKPNNFTATGIIAAEPAIGENLTLEGEWVIDRKYGKQLKISSCTSALPVTINGLEKFLASGLIKNVGPATARKIVDEFGDETMDVLDNHPERIADIRGISAKKADEIAKGWREQKDIREVMVFLQGYGVGPGYATKIYNQYGAGTIELLQTNPYRIAIDIDGIGFAIADNIASKLGFVHDSPKRIEAGVRHVLNKITGDGNVYAPIDVLAEAAAEALSVDKESALAGIEDARLQESIVVETFTDENGSEEQAVYLPALHHCEVFSAKNLKRIISEPYKSDYVDCDELFPQLEDVMSIKFAESQKDAIKTAVASKVMVITGGPGTGKTTIIRAVLNIRESMGLTVLLAAPTGRAAKRMSEATGHEAKTIHRLLESQGGLGADCVFARTDKYPLECDLLIIDEASMLDQVLFHYLLKAVPSSASLILVGDVDQLPSVSSGNVLNDIIKSEICPVVALTQIFRQGESSRIIVNAHRINRGEMPLLTPPANGRTDFYFIEPTLKQDIGETDGDFRNRFNDYVIQIIKKLISDRIPNVFHLNPCDDIQVLSPVHSGVLGTKNLNDELQKLLNKRQGDHIERANQIFKVGDKVMQIKNNYDKDVFNGDIGIIDEIDDEEHALSVIMDSGTVIYDYSELDELVHAYAVTIHKSQGSEYPAVIIPFTMSHYVMLKRNLLYTGITRGKKLVIIIGTKQAIQMAVSDDKTKKRWTRLAERLAESQTKKEK